MAESLSEIALRTAQQDFRSAMTAHEAALPQGDNTAAAPAREPRYVKIKVLVTLDEVSLRLVLGDKHLDKSLLNGCVVPFLNAYNKRVETYKQVAVGDLISLKLNGELIGQEDLDAQARYMLGRAWARAEDKATSQGEPQPGVADVEIRMVLGTRATHEREWYESQTG